PAETSAEPATVKAATVKAAALGERVIRQAGQQRQCCNSSKPNPFHALPPCPPVFPCTLASHRSGVREGRWGIGVRRAKGSDAALTAPCEARPVNGGRNMRSVGSLRGASAV